MVEVLWWTKIASRTEDNALRTKGRKPFPVSDWEIMNYSLIVAGRQQAHHIPQAAQTEGNGTRNKYKRYKIDLYTFWAGDTDHSGRRQLHASVTRVKSCFQDKNELCFQCKRLSWPNLKVWGDITLSHKLLGKKSPPSPCSSSRLLKDVTYAASESKMAWEKTWSPEKSVLQNSG